MFCWKGITKRYFCYTAYFIFFEAVIIRPLLFNPKSIQLLLCVEQRDL